MVASRRFERVFTWLVKFIVASGGLRLLRAIVLWPTPNNQIAWCSLSTWCDVLFYGIMTQPPFANLLETLA